MNKHKYKKIYLLLFIILIEYFLVFQDYSRIFRFFLAMWLISATMYFFREDSVKIELNPVKMKVYKSDGENTTEVIIKDMNEDGYRPATLAETLIWLRNKSKQRLESGSLVALGSSKIEKKIRKVPVIDADKSGDIYYRFDLSEDEWEANYRFLGVFQSK